MIPLQLTISGFLSYRERVELDFSSFDLACISGPNGAGKSSILDAITWALFGQARKRDDTLINTQADLAEVTFTFAYETNIYRVLRTNPRGKTTRLEFQILQDSSGAANWRDGSTWKALTERTLRATQANIEKTLRLDYKTFVNASFFLQGKADQFTQQPPSERKRILSNVLGLEIWEGYRQRAVERRKKAELEIAGLDARLEDIQQELAEEGQRKARLKEAEEQLELLTQTRVDQENTLVQIRQTASMIAQLSEAVTALARQLDATTNQVQDLERRLDKRREERAGYEGILQRAPDIEANFQAWQQARTDIRYWDEIAARYYEVDKKRLKPQEIINTRRASLEQERKTLEEEFSRYEENIETAQTIQAELTKTQEQHARLEAEAASRDELDKRLQELLQKQADARAENPRLKDEMVALKERIDSLEQLADAVCPFCNQPLSATDRDRLVAELKIDGSKMGDRYRANKSLLEACKNDIKGVQEQISNAKHAQAEERNQARKLEQLKARLEQINQAINKWQTSGAQKISEVKQLLTEETFAQDARQLLEQINTELKTIGYDEAAHIAAREAEAKTSSAENEMRTLEKARAALAPLEREIGDLEKQITQRRDAQKKQQAEYDQMAATLAAAQATAPDLKQAEKELQQLRERENQLREVVGGARQKVLVLKDLKKRRAVLEKEREELGALVGRYKLLERSFGKDGVPALLIEQAIPEIESKANNILERLSGGQMSVRFITQATYKDKQRQDLRETLEIQINDGVGTRDYEMYSGGEAFRVNFAIRLALSEILAQRAGARLQTLVIDEGFGSQDAIGRQRLIEAINLVRQDFAKVLVITHIEELKDAFPTRLEVLKINQSSVIQVST